MSEKLLSELLRRGGILRGIEGGAPKEVITNIVRSLTLPETLPAPVLLEAILERENLMPTSIGYGIALPHPRNPMIADSNQFMTLAFLCDLIDWQALDGVPVQTVLLLVSSSAREHLHALSRIHFLCREKTFCARLAETSSDEDIFSAIAAIEKEWGRG